MKSRILYLVIALMTAVAPSVMAQRGQEGNQHRRHSEIGPVAELLRHRTELKLSEEQTRQLQEIDRRMDEQNRPYVEQLLQIRRSLHVRPGVRKEEMTDAEREEFRESMGRAAPLWEQIRKNNHAAMRQVGEVLNSEQKAHLRELLRTSKERNGSPGPERSQRRRG
jgi:Spy/CpxP family protein refolding chaperone